MTWLLFDNIKIFNVWKQAPKCFNELASNFYWMLDESDITIKQF